MFEGRTILPNTGLFWCLSSSTNSQKWEAGFAEGLREGFPLCFHQTNWP